MQAFFSAYCIEYELTGSRLELDMGNWGVRNEDLEFVYRKTQGPTYERFYPKLGIMVLLGNGRNLRWLGLILIS